MTARQLLHPDIAFRQTGAPARALGSAEMILLLVTICMLLLVAGLWARGAITGPVQPVMVKITVQPGDTLWSLAKEHGDPDQYILARVDSLAKANGLRQGEALHAGQTLVIPVANRYSKLYYGGNICKRTEGDTAR